MGLPVIEASEVIEMDEDPGPAVRRKKQSSLVRAAEAVRDGEACAMVSAGNTGATMASALLRMGRLKGIARPGIATPIPRVGTYPSILIDAGANAECTSAKLVQFAADGRRVRLGPLPHRLAERCAAFDRRGADQGQRAGQRRPTRRSPSCAGINFVGNVEGRDLLPGTADVVVTDGFTGNVALKALEGSLQFFMGALLEVFSIDEDTKRASEILMPHLAPLAEDLDPDGTGGAVLLGVKGVCVISHGSSNARAIVSAVRVAHEAAAGDLVGRLQASVAQSPGHASHPGKALKIPAG